MPKPNFPKPKVPGLFTGMKITFTTLIETLYQGRGIKTFIPSRPPAARSPCSTRTRRRRRRRARGVIALNEENCTACMLCARSAPTGASTSRATSTSPRPVVTVASRARTTSSTASTSTSRSACTAASASRCARSRPCSGAPSTSTPSPASPSCCTTRSGWASGWRPCPDFEPYEAGSEQGQEGAAADARAASVAQNIAFCVIAALIVFGALRVVTTKNVVHAALWLVLVLAGVAAQYILLAAEFVAVTQVLVYIGAIVVLFLFGIMLTRAKIGSEQRPQQPARLLGAASPVAVLLLGVMGYALIDEYARARRCRDTRLDAVDHRRRSATRSSRPTSSRSRSISVLLLAALIGAIVLARKD